jgi:murein DD-endopeptidase MepM/ murein hydrolase activator NlpD
VWLLGFGSLILYSQTQSNSNGPIRDWFGDPGSRPGLSTAREPCPGAPFLLPSEGFIGLLWADPALPYNLFNRHTGIDIFGDGQPGTVPVYAAYPGRLSRLDNWLSTVIIQHDDPLQPGRVIWTYYTHMASRDGAQSYIVPDFPMRTAGVWVEAGTLLGYQGEFAGAGATPIGMHLHFSIVLSEESGAFKNESVLDNTLDPSPYFGMRMNIEELPTRPIRCGG